jgi:RNA polymerase sporulation-specific sigma factor
MTSDAALVLRARGGDELAAQRLVERYRDLVRLKASSYFLLGGESDDLIQEGLVGLYKAIREYRTDRESRFRNFAELCITRQIITAVKTATRGKHKPLNDYVSFASVRQPTRHESELTLESVLPGPWDADPVERLCARDELARFADGLDSLSRLERAVAGGFAGGESYEQMARRVGVTVKTIDNAAQRVKRKLGKALEERPYSAVARVEFEEQPEPEVLSSKDVIEAFLWRNPGSTAKQIAEGTDLSYDRVLHLLHCWGPGLTKAKRPKGKGWLWYMVVREVAA